MSEQGKRSHDGVVSKTMELSGFCLNCSQTLPMPPVSWEMTVMPALARTGVSLMVKNSSCFLELKSRAVRPLIVGSSFSKNFRTTEVFSGSRSGQFVAMSMMSFSLVVEALMSGRSSGRPKSFFRKRP